MRTFIFCVTRVAVAFVIVAELLFAVAPAAELEPPANDVKQKLSPTDQLVREALLAEADGNANLRAEKSRQALALGNDSNAAHWLAGQVRVGSNWLSVDDAAREATQAGKLEEYRKRRNERGNTLEDHIALARLSAKLGLKENERGHLLLALQLDPSNKEAFMKSGLARKNGQFFTPQQLVILKETTASAVANAMQWTPRLQKLRRQLETPGAEHEEVLNQIRSIHEVEAIPSMEFVLGNANERVALAVVDAIKSINEQPATESLVRFIAFRGEKSIQAAALDGLQYRDRDNFLPVMINALKAPVEVQHEAMQMNSGLGILRCLQFQEGALGNHALVLTEIRPVALNDNRRQQDYAKVSQINEENQLRNERLFAALANVTGVQRQSPAEWWDWWFNEMGYQPIDKATKVSYRLRASCFVRGTPVWTSTGPMPIEKIKAGEAVLAQDPLTGELAYKAVLATTYRPPSPVVEVNLGTSTIRGTRGHPYWVSGEGWRMAKQLKAGQMLHTVNGTVRIESATQVDEAECFNLVVADFNTYFVGEAKVLVHDNTLRGPNTIRVPGLVE